MQKIQNPRWRFPRPISNDGYLSDIIGAVNMKKETKTKLIAVFMVLIMVFVVFVSAATFIADL